MNRKHINIPKVLRFSWLRAEGFESLFQQLKNQKLKFFLELSGKIYPDLVKVFFTNLEFKNDVLLSSIKGVRMKINKKAWKDVVGLKSRGVQLGLFQNSTRCNTMVNAWGILLLKSSTSMLRGWCWTSCMSSMCPNIHITTTAMRGSMHWMAKSMISMTCWTFSRPEMILRMIECVGCLRSCIASMCLCFFQFQLY